MHYQRLGQSGLRVSRLALGTMTFGYQTDEAESRRILDKAVDAGISLIDTADVYPLGGDLTTQGRTEAILGRWLPGKRENLIIATKAVGRVGPKPWQQGASYSHLLAAADASLRRLGTDYIDLYQLHSDDPQTPLDETLRALEQLLRSGKVRYLGVSNFLAYRLAQALGRQELLGFSRFIAVQPRYSLLFREIERELLPLAQETGLGVIPYNPLAGGLLTGKHQPGTPTAATRFSLGSAAERYQQRYWHPEQFAVVSELQQRAQQAGLNLATASLGWVLAQPVVSSVLIGASSAGQLDATLAAIDSPLPAELVEQFDQLTRPFRRGDALR